MHDIYDVQGLIAAFGGRTGLIEKLRKGTGVVAKRKTVDKWLERNSIPGDVLVLCQIAANNLDLDISITDYIKREREPNATTTGGDAA